jgi:hypothetical protein
MSFSPPNVTPDTTEAIDDAIALLNAAMEELSKRRQQLMQRRNTLSPFGRLHPELVLEIFIICTTEPMVFRESPIPRYKSWVPHAPNVRAVLTLSHVSRQFRQITFSTGTLWSAPPFATCRSPSLAKLALQRAASAPLSICLRPTPGSYVEWDVLRGSHRLDLATTRDLWLPIGSWQDWMDALPTAIGLRSFCAHLDSPRSSSIIGLNTAHLTTLALAGTGAHLSPLGSGDATLSRLERLSLYLNQATQQDVALVLRILARAVHLTDHLTIDTSSPNLEHTAFRWAPDVTAEACTGRLRFEHIYLYSTSNEVDWTALTSLRLHISTEEYDKIFRGRDNLYRVLMDAPLNTLEVWAEVCKRVFEDRHALRPDATPPFPRLRLLRLIYPEGDPTYQYEEERHFLLGLSTSIHRFLAERATNGYPLETLVVESWGELRSLLEIFSTSAPAVQYVDMT